MDNRFYKSSGKFSLSFFLIYPLVIPIALAILSFAYAHIIYFSPIVYLNFLVVVGCGIVAGFIVGFAVKLGKVRNQILATVIALFSSVLMKYLMWLFYIPLVYVDAYDFFNLTFVEKLDFSRELLLKPTWVWEFVKEINEFGVWGLANTNVAANGIFLTIIWIGEFVVLTGACIFVAGYKAKLPFCEENNAWFKRSKEIKLNLPSNSVQLKEQLLAGNNEGLFTLLAEPLWVATDDHLAVTLYTLEGISYGYMTLSCVSRPLSKNGDQKTQRQTLVNNLKIDMQLLSAFQNQLRMIELRTKNKK